ncbi:thioesterase family protein [soil metagenome]
MTAARPVVVTIAVQWGDMDALGHVNNTRFFAWFESARVALFERLGLMTKGPSALGPILATTTCDFLRPVVYPATVRVGATVSKIGETSMAIDYLVESAEGDVTCARGTSVVVLVDYATMQKVRIPDDLRAAIAAL